jgi:hypothetical protein
MRIIDIGEDRYHVLKEIPPNNDAFVDRVTKLYKDRVGIVVLRSTSIPNQDPHHLICRLIEAVEYEEIDVTQPKKITKKKSKKKKSKRKKKKTKSGVGV